MKNIAVILALALAVLQFLPAAAEKELLQKLPPQYRKWLTEDVVYIISPVERGVFLQLQSDLEREQFIKGFWKQRDPNPSTPQNEFQIEHRRRIEYANTWFGKESPGPGWMSDQGRIYILLGEPKSIEKYENKTELRPTIVWYYQGLMDYGLPNAFSVVFFKQDYTGDYRLYSPVRFGPQALMYNYTGDMTDYQQAYTQLQGIEPVIADLSLSLIPGENPGMAPSLASEALLSTKIPVAPVKKVKTAYAEKMLRYKDMIEMDYTANYIENAKMTAVLLDPRSGIHFVHYLIEPKRLSLEAYEGRYYTTLEVFGSVADMEGRPVFQFNKSVPIELSQEQMQRIQDKLFSFQDMFPLVPGRYRLTVLLKNTVSREFTSIEETLVVSEKPAPGIAALFLANKLVENSGYRGQSKPFLLDDRQLVPSPRNDFTQNDPLYLFCQLAGSGDELHRGGSLRVEILKEGAVVRTQEKRLGDYPQFPDVLERFPLSGLAPANYVARVTLLAEKGQALAADEASFYISPVAVLPRPWVLSLPQSSSTAPQYWNDLGSQYLQLGRKAEARERLERAYHLAPQTPRFVLDFCRILMEQRDFRQAKDVALRAFQGQGRDEFLLPLAQAGQALGEYREAAEHYGRYIAHAGPSVRTLNALGECQLAAGDRRAALESWEKSLQLDDKQAQLKEKVAALKRGTP